MTEFGENFVGMILVTTNDNDCIVLVLTYNSECKWKGKQLGSFLFVFRNNIPNQTDIATFIYKHSKHILPKKKSTYIVII